MTKTVPEKVTDTAVDAAKTVEKKADSELNVLVKEDGVSLNFGDLR